MDLIPRKFYLDDFFDSFINSKDTSMKCDVYEENGDYHIEMDIPGFNKKDISIEANNGYLTITAEKTTEDNNECKNYIRKERNYGKFQRSFYLGELDEENIKAKFSDGMLKIQIPKKINEENKKTIEIE